MQRPNLFTFATSELSQDAFLCWLLSWADPVHRDHDRDLHGVAKEFLDAILKEAGVAAGPNDKVRVHKQLKFADIVAEVGENLVLVIEDKTHTGDSAENLERRAKAIGDRFPGRELACVYLKTGDQSSYVEASDAGWAVFTRAKLLSVLRSAQGAGMGHDVYVDFLAHLQQLEVDVNRFRTVAPFEWRHRDPAYKGLYLALQEVLKTGSWKYVHNASGGFMCFWWPKTRVEGGTVTLQLEEHQLVVKLSVPEKDKRKALRKRWSHRVLNEMSDFRKPHHFGNGRTMTVATYGPLDYRVFGRDGLLDLAATGEVLRGAALAVARVTATSALPIATDQTEPLRP